MKLSFSYLYLIALSCWAIISSCSNDTNQTPTPAGGPLQGTVQLWDDKINPLTDHSGVTVTVDDLSSLSATTDASGKYSLASLPYGLHDLTLSKGGIGSYRLFGVAHTQSATASTLPTIILGKTATTSVTSLSVAGTTYNGGPGVSLLYSVSPTPTATNRGYVRYFLSTDPAVSSTNYRYVSPVVSALNNNVTGGFTKDDLITAGFSTNQTVYVRLYGESVQSNSYTDPNVGKSTFPNLNTTTSPAVSFIMP
ncbi:carboxypeptidase-like regulatory domain-containing protein [Spirosoma lituiforme]